ncbi:MAG: glucuronate isomerase [Deltaproteobacteria bacterium]|nr:glucuronate isomerase [Deltaproteobacteria bacterium]
MTKPFLSEDFLLQTETARRLYHDFAEDMPIFDYHCHLPVSEIAEDKTFENLTQIWLKGDHYKWRAMRAAGVEERLVTGDAADEEKFEAWAATVPKTLRNPLYHWTHLELKRYFGISGKLLNPETAKDIYTECSKILQTKDFSAREILKRMNVRVVCTTDDPVDTLEHHRRIREDRSFSIKVLPAFRPDKALGVESPETFNHYVGHLETAAGVRVTDLDSFLEAIKKRHDVFHEAGCRLSDHGIECPYAENFALKEIRRIFLDVRQGRKPQAHEALQFKSAMLMELAKMDAQKGWTQQFHFGALRNVNSKAMRAIGPDTGYDSIGDFELARSLAKFLDALDKENQLAKTILYVINPRDNELMASMIGNFQDGSLRGKMQFGAAWWFNDQKEGMERQINALSNMGLLSCFVGMLTDSRSFLSYPRHEYFRRVLCNLLGTDVENGELPDDMELIGNMVKDICFQNAVQYFGIEPA